MRRIPIAILLIVLAFAATAATASAKAPNDFFGVVPQELPSVDDYEHLASGDVRVARLQFNWAQVQQVPGKCQAEQAIERCNWSILDETVANLASVGVRVFPTLTGTPGFVSKKHPDQPPLKKKDLNRWEGFARAAAARYGRDGHFWDSYSEYGGKPLPVKDWQVWNEPNSKQFWHPAPNGRDYAKLVKASSQSLRKGDKKSNVVLGGMFPDAKVPIVPFMKQFSKLKKSSRYYDEIGVHPYASGIGALKNQLGDARRAAKGNTKIRITELGWSSAKGGHPLNKGKGGQAKMLKKGFRLAKKKRKSWNISGVIWFALRDTNNKSTCAFCLRSGLFEVGGKPKPAWRAFKKFSK